jgi:hypothetical protein
MWLLNNNSKVGHIVYMRSNVIFDDLSPHLRLVGEAKHVQKIVVRKIISVDVLSWTITRISPDADNPRFQSVTMAAKDFRHNNLKVDLQVTSPIVLTLLHVPKTLPHLSLRVLWVMRGVLNCLFCKELPRSAQSFDTQHAAHRVLCSHCLDLLFVAETQLRRRCKVSSTRWPPDQVPRVHFVRCFSGAPTSCWPCKETHYVLKQDVARFFKQPTWTAFIENNYSMRKTKPKTTSGFYFNSRWF